ncbi:MAG: nucleotidyltransferase domain-containing protein [Candidatus Omnitrophota bacterium]|nr:nucleotidyltransferase domain-containing protein [Candidatus Omnitrophota bacterium]
MEHIKIMQVFYSDPTRVYTINEISKLLLKPYGTTYNYIQSLIKENVLKYDIKGKATICSINFKSQKAIEILSLLSVSGKEAFTKKQALLSNALDELGIAVKEKLNHNIFSLILFGSTVKGTAREKSDIDLFFITPSKDKYDEIIENECNALRMRYGRDINPITAEPKMYINMLREAGENTGKQILRDKIIFFGSNKFWELTMEALK